MTIQAWTFLISRNQSIDYKTVVAPDFISEAKIRSLLAKVTEEDFAESGRISILEVKGSEVGSFTVIFRSVKARSKDIGEEGDEVLKDPFGREIYWVEGLVFQNDLHEIRYKIGESHLDQAHRELQQNYSEFWHNDKLSVSHKIDLLEVASESDNKFRVLNPFVIAQKLQLPEHRLSEEQGRKNYSPSKPVRSKKNLIRLVLIIIAELLLIIGISTVWSISHSANTCLSIESSIKIIQDDNLPSTIDKLKNLEKDHKTAWIWLNGSLNVEKALVDKIKKEVKDQEKQSKVEKQEKQSISTAAITIYPKANDANQQSTLSIKNYPIGFAITLLQNKDVKDFNGVPLTVTIVEPTSQMQSSCKLKNS